MKNIIGLLIISTVLFSSCSKEIKMCIDGEMNPSVPGTYTYTWCGENADEFQWTSGASSNILTGESIQLTFNHKVTYNINVVASNKRKDKSESYTINVGTHEARIEPLVCGSGNLTYSSGIVTAYLYNGRADLQLDLRNNNKSNCLDSVALESTTYYNGTLDNSTSVLANGFKGVASGEYIVYIQENVNPFKNNLKDIIYYNVDNNLVVTNNEDYDDACFTSLTSSSNQYVKTLVSKTYILTTVSINGSSHEPPSECNADDSIIFNIDGTWAHNVGADDCSGGQINSHGTYSGFNSCENGAEQILTFTVTSGTLVEADYIHVRYYNASQIKVISGIGPDTIEQIFTTL